MGIAINRLVAAQKIIEAYEAGEFRKISSGEAWRLGFDIARPEALFLDHPDFVAICAAEGGRIEVSQPAGTSWDSWILDPATGCIMEP